MWNLPLLCLLLFAGFGSGQQNFSDCTAFSSNGVAASQFQYYRFYDFRHMKSSKGPDVGSSGSRFKLVTGSSWKDDWYIRNFPRKSPGGYAIPVNFVPEKVYMTNEADSKFNYSSYLSLNTARVSDVRQDSAEITFKEFNVSYASIRVHGRVHGAPGAVAGVFTYLNDTEESDIEMFTRAPSQYVQYSNQPASLGPPTWADIPGATVNVTMPGGKKYTDWHIHRLDWTPGQSVFFVDDEQTNATTLQVPVADPPSGLYIDMWSANSTWTGSMEVGKNATFDILWIELLFNTSKPVDATGSQKVCTIRTEDLSAPAPPPTQQPKSPSMGARMSWPSWALSLTAVMLAFMLI